MVKSSLLAKIKMHVLYARAQCQAHNHCNRLVYIAIERGNKHHTTGFVPDVCLLKLIMCSTIPNFLAFTLILNPGGSYDEFVQLSESQFQMLSSWHLTGSRRHLAYKYGRGIFL